MDDCVHLIICAQIFLHQRHFTYINAYAYKNKYTRTCVNRIYTYMNIITHTHTYTYSFNNTTIFLSPMNALFQTPPRCLPRCGTADHALAR